MVRVPLCAAVHSQGAGRGGVGRSSPLVLLIVVVVERGLGSSSLHVHPPGRDPALKVASSTPTRPLETPPYTLVPLLHPVFASSRPTSPPPPPPALTAAPPSSPPPVSRITQLVSSVAAAAAASSSTPTPPAPQPSLRTVEAAAHHVWLGTSHGTVRLYSVAQQHADHAPSIEGLLSPGPASPPSTPRRSSRQHQVCPSFPRAPVSS